MPKMTVEEIMAILPDTASGIGQLTSGLSEEQLHAVLSGAG